MSALSLPNILTYGRILAVPAVVACYALPNMPTPTSRWVALAIFAAAAITDFFDGYLARAWGQQSSLGRMLDPIADKLLVASCLLILVDVRTIQGWSVIAAVIILCREILVSGLREFLATARVSLPVSQLAKWKTTFQMVSLGALILAPASAHWWPALPSQPVGLVTLWLAGLLTMITGWDYLRVGLKHMTDEA